MTRRSFKAIGLAGGARLAARQQPLYAGITTTYLDREELEKNPKTQDFSSDKLIRAIEAARKAGPDGIAIFAASSITQQKLWPALEEAFRI